MNTKTIPHSWKLVRLGEMSNITTGKKDVNEGSSNGRYPFFTCSQKEYRIDEYSFNTEAILVAGNAYFNVKYYKGKFDAYQRTYVIDGFKDNISKYVYYVLSKDIRELTANNQGSAVKYIKLKDLTDFHFPLPPINERQRIIEILTILDSVIEKTQAIIDQTQTLKKGMMQELLTRGIPGRHKKFKETEIGKIPEEWEVKFTNDVCLINPPKKEISKLSRDITVSFIPMENIAAEGGGIISREERKLSEVEAGYTYFTEGDIVFAKITPCMENGKVAIMTDLVNNIGFGSTEFHVLRVHDNLVRYFLFYWITRKMFRSLARNYFTGTAGQQRIQADFFSIAKIPLPPKEEQKEIVKILDKIVSSVAFKTQEITQLSYLKSALMQSLLTGEVRVKV